MSPVYNFFGRILAFFYGLVPHRSYGLGIAIILLTVVVMLALFPLTAKQAKSMMAMQRAQPQIKAIQAKHKNDRQKMNEEVMKFYQENKINPLAGCLPLVIQLPIFFSLFRVMRTPQEHVPVDSALFRALCGTARNAAACGTHGLPNHLKFLGMDLAEHATGVKGSFVDALPYFVLVALVVVTGFAQARQSQRNVTNMNPQMALITKVLPVGFGLFSLQFPAGLVLYFFVSNLWRIGQQEIILRKITGPGATAGAIDARSSPARPPASKPEGTSGAGGGLRKLFQLPSAADPSSSEDAAASNGTGETKPSNPARSSGGARGSGAAPGERPGQAGRRNTRKRRRR